VNSFFLYFFLRLVPQLTVFFLRRKNTKKGCPNRTNRVKKTTPRRDGVHTPNARRTAEPYIRYTYPYNLYLVRIQRRSITFRYDKSVGQIGAAVFLSANNGGGGRMALFYRKKKPTHRILLTTLLLCSDGKKNLFLRRNS